MPLVSIGPSSSDHLKNRNKWRMSAIGATYWCYYPQERGSLSGPPLGSEDSNWAEVQAAKGKVKAGSPSMPADEQFRGKLWHSVVALRPSKHSESLPCLLFSSDIVLLPTTVLRAGVAMSIGRWRNWGYRVLKATKELSLAGLRSAWLSGPVPFLFLSVSGTDGAYAHFRERCWLRLPNMHLYRSSRLGCWGIFLPWGSCWHGISLSSWLFCSSCYLWAAF